LNDTVPEKIREHFETTKNLLLYSWFVYRFIPVAEFHAATTLEYALKEGGIRGRPLKYWLPQMDVPYFSKTSR